MRVRRTRTYLLRTDWKIGEDSYTKPLPLLMKCEALG